VSLLITDLPAHLTAKKLDGDDQVECFMCDKRLRLKNMRKHVGQHILFAFRGMSDKLPLKPGMHVGVIPCGWCGREGQCQVQLVGKEKSYSVISSCPYHYSKMSYTRALQPNKSSPCTNVPIHCPICPHSLSGQPRTIWKYNAMNHFITEHKPASDSKTLTEISPSFLVESFISSQEENWMGIPGNAIKEWRDEHEIPDTDGIEEIINTSEANKRERAESVVSTQPPKKTPRILHEESS
jgi:hypothetical protein